MVLTQGVNGVSPGCTERNSNIELNGTNELSDVELSGVDCNNCLNKVGKISDGVYSQTTRVK